MKKIILLVGIAMLLLVLSGCDSNYQNCVDDCAKIKCGYSGMLRPTASSKLDNPCLSNPAISIREYCYEECK